ncbi:FAD/NAD(P)-binding domain-containing protein [Peniophora sp. CONT]|nr:FAD/NAD(P)-binding domain-containing protein [Peniophora sp. CONT]
MSNASASALPPESKTFLQVHVVVVGGGVAGLSAAVALSRVGHRVTLLERDEDFDQAYALRNKPTTVRGIRMPPNMTKIFNHWGMRSAIDEIGTVSGQVIMSRIEDSRTLGKHVWNHEMLEEAGGEFIFLDYHNLRQVLLRAAKDLGATIRTNSEVSSVSDDGRYAILTDGERVHADVIVGATGRLGLIRDLLCQDQSGDDTGKPRGLMLFDAVVPAAKLRADPELRELLHEEFSRDDDFAFYLYVPDDGKTPEARVKAAPSEIIAAHTANFEPRIQKLAAAASGTCVKLVTREVLEDWVHSSGRLVGIGDAVHPFVPGSIQGPCMSLEDASVLAKLFSHLLEESQIPSFLYAFEEIRRARTVKINDVDNNNIDFMTMPSGPMATGRDDAMAATFQAGRNALDAEEGDDASSQWTENREIFGYDAEDAANEWWVSWGILRLRAKDAPELGELSGVKGVAIARSEH